MRAALQLSRLLKLQYARPDLRAARIGPFRPLRAGQVSQGCVVLSVARMVTKQNFAGD